MKLFLISTAALALAAVPASAQILGGGGGGGLTGGLGGTIGRTTGSITGMGSSAGDIGVERSIDRRSGRASARARGSKRASGSTASSGTLLGRTIDGSASGSGSGSAEGGADAQLVGTDFVRGQAGQARETGRGVIAGARDRAGGLGSGMGGGAVSGGGSGSGQGSASGGFGGLGFDAAGAASGAGSFVLQRGMAVEDARGRVIGRVQEVRTTARGAIQTVLVRVGERTAALPASNFSGSGNVLVSAMSKGEVKSEARQQERAAEAAPATSDHR